MKVRYDKIYLVVGWIGILIWGLFLFQPKNHSITSQVTAGLKGGIWALIMLFLFTLSWTLIFEPKKSLLKKIFTSNH